jgi:signal transduction histidine kinase
MKKFFSTLVFLLVVHSTYAQALNLDSLRSVVSHNGTDTNTVNALVRLSIELTPSDSVDNHYIRQALLLAEKLSYKKGKADCLFIIATQNSNVGNFAAGIQYALDALNIYKDLSDNVGIASVHLMLQATYRDVEDYRRALIYALAGEQIADAHNVVGKFMFSGMHLAPLFLAEIAQTYVLMNQLDSASFYVQESINKKEPYNGAEWNFPVYLLATIQTTQRNYEQALKNYHLSVLLAIQNGVDRDVLQNFSGMSTLFKKTGQLDSSIYYAQIVAQSRLPDLEAKNLHEALTNLAEVYRSTGKKDSAIKYLVLSYALKDSIFSREKDREIQGVAFKEQLKQQEIIAEQAKFKSRLQLYALTAGLFVLILVALILWRNNLHKQKSKEEIERAYGELKSTQTQLIQSEKMASLGQLTAGIAHEIQNPLNFVNNFSEVNKDLLAEMKDEIGKGNLNEAMSLANSAIENEEKITYHGKRADSIVKGMLQHSKTSSGQKELTDINKLADEYLRLSYHGIRAKDKSFNATMETDFDNSIGKINVAPQDIGRAFQNLFNNAFYAAHQRENQNLDGSYEANVTVTTKRKGSMVTISVKDNGNGIPQAILDKIFQPFFTTKPTGQGTGLGLSLAYDIVKAHGGVIKVETKEREGTEFIIQLPNSS